MIDWLTNKVQYMSVIMTVTAFLSCTPEINVDNIDFEPQIVVDGWIENGQPANVILTQWLPVNSDNYISVKEIPIKWAKVTVSDGEKEEVLAGGIDSKYNPPYVYRGYSIRGECGKTYKLKVEYADRVVTAETTIPEPVEILDYKISKCKDSGLMYSVDITFEDEKDRKNYYKVFSMVHNKDSRFYSSFMGTVNDKVSDGDGMINMQVNRGYRFDNDGFKYTPYYSLYDKVSIKLTQINKKEYDFWLSYENEVTNGKNPLFPNTSNLQSNIQGGKGIWCGYASDVINVSIYVYNVILDANTGMEF